MSLQSWPKMLCRRRCCVVLPVCLLVLNACGHDYKFYMREGDGFRDKAKWSEAAQNYESGLKEARKEKTKEPALTMLLRLADLKRMENKNEEALKQFDQAADLAEKIPAEGTAKKAAIYAQMAAIYLKTGDTEAGMAKLKESLQILSDAGESDSHAAADANALLGTTYSQSQQMKLADKHLRKAVSQYESLQPVDADALSRTLYTLANNCRLTGQEDEAMALEEKAKHLSVNTMHETTAGEYTKRYQ